MQASIGNNDLNWSLDFWEFHHWNHVTKWPFWANWLFLDSHWLIICWFSLVVEFEFLIYIHLVYFVSFSFGTLIPSYEASSVACVHFLSCECTFSCTFHRAFLNQFLCKFSAIQVYTGKICNIHFTIRFKLSQSRVSFTS